MPSKRPIRRRGRAPHASDSDDEDIERAAQTDSDESNDSLDESDSDSDSEPVSRHLTPNTSHSPDADEKPAPFFAATPAAWADMVDDAAGLPVITFGELDAHAVRAIQPDSDDEPEQPVSYPSQPVASSSRHSPAPFVRSPRSQSARQAYQHRLESDPSFVPVVGEFWGHDDRLLDKDLRSLSGWWRGRWQGRARGAAYPPRGRGRGGFSNPTGPHSVAAPDAEPAAPVDRAWTHDGFEEMRRREDTRTRPPMPRGGPPMRGSPSFRARGMPLGRAPGRIWFTMKPEHMWTKQHDAFLYFDPALKPRPGQPPGVRVHLPGGPTAVVRALPRTYRQPRPAQKRSAPDTDYVVRIPRRVLRKAKAAEVELEDAFTVKLPPQPAPVPAPAPPHPLQPDADGWVRPTPAAVALAAAASPPPAPPSALPAQAQISHAHAQPPQFFPFAPPPGFAFPAGPTFGPPPPGFAQHQQPPPAFQQQQQQQVGFSHTPPPFTHTPPPGFATPPGFNAPLPLPPGVALDARGMPFEVASGRPVVLQAPVMFPGHYSPAHHAHSLSMHGHGHSMSMGHHSPSMSVGVGGAGPDPGLFAFARPGRVEIRAPGSAGAGGSAGGSGAGTPVSMNGNGKMTPQRLTAFCLGA
ncbi:hypothetical protein C8R47DRAFT_1234682 [Mycena vitilis]|nr:hypothetical protein C8R47DRAFT_1234682 [Mycena vitilis]